MAAEFNKVKALGEQLQGLREVLETLLVQTRAAEDEMARAEKKLNGMRKLYAFADNAVESKRRELQIAMKEAEEAAAHA